MSVYANLQLLLGEKVEAPCERIVYAVTSYMEGIGMMPCDRESAEHIVCFAPTSKGWVVFDDCAERGDLNSLDGLGRCLTNRFQTSAIGIFSDRQQKILRLYIQGRRKDSVSVECRIEDNAPAFLRNAYIQRGHAFVWKPLLPKGRSLKDLTDVFAHPDSGDSFERIANILELDSSYQYGFSSIESSKIQNVISLYFCSSTHVRQRWMDRLWNPTRRTAITLGSFIRRSHADSHCREKPKE